MERSEAPAWRLTGVNTCGVSNTAEGGAEGKRGDEQEGRGGSDSTEGYCGRGDSGEYEFEVRERGEGREGGNCFQGGHFGGALEPVAVDADRGKTRHLLGLERVKFIQLWDNRGNETTWMMWMIASASKRMISSIPSPFRSYANGGE